MNTPIFNKGETVLFIGDSITDAGRNYEQSDSLGWGYASMSAGFFGLLHPELQIKFLNRGISGNRIHDLEKRWKEDCLDLRPDWVSIMVGINDAARRYDRNFEHTTTEEFIGVYRQLLKQAEENSGAKFVIIEPFLLPTSELRRQYREDLDPKIHALRDLAQEIGALYVPLDGLFAEARSLASNEYWAPDGVHPTPAGHALMARAWLKAVGVKLA